MTTLRVRSYGRAAWTYFTADGPDEGLMLALMLSRLEDTEELHVQEWDDETDDWRMRQI